jgi:hypothetical protein
MNYAELQENIAKFLNREDLVKEIPMFIELAEARIRRDLRERSMQVRAEADCYAEYFKLPCDWVETKTVICDDRILRLIDGFNIERATLTGPTKFYRHVEDQLQLLPAPSEKHGSRLILEYLAEVTRLSDANDTNWLLDRYPDIYLYGALLSATSYLHDDQRIPIWSQAYGEAVSAANMASDRAEYSGSALRLQRHGVA